MERRHSVEEWDMYMYIVIYVTRYDSSVSHYVLVCKVQVSIIKSHGVV